MIIFSVILIIITAAFIADIIIENKFMLKIRREKPVGNIKIFHLADLHKRKNIVRKICRAAENESPDLIFITGDLVSRSQTDFSEVDQLLGRLCEIAPIYMCFGNHEQSLPNGNQHELLDILRKNHVRLLLNENEEIVINGRNIRIYGLMQKYSTYKKNGGYRHLDGFTVGEMEELIGKVPECETFLLAHNPLFAKEYAEWGAAHTFSGHVHGGTIRLFGVGMLSPERRFFPKYSKGMYTIGKNQLHVTTGIGKLRILNPPEAVIYNL